MKIDCHELILSYCGHRFCHKFMALGLPYTMTFVDKEEVQPTMGFCSANACLRMGLMTAHAAHELPLDGGPVCQSSSEK